MENLFLPIWVTQELYENFFKENPLAFENFNIKGMKVNVLQYVQSAK